MGKRTIMLTSFISGVFGPMLYTRKLNVWLVPAIIAVELTTFIGYKALVTGTNIDILAQTLKSHALEKLESIHQNNRYPLGHTPANLNPSVYEYAAICYYCFGIDINDAVLLGYYLDLNPEYIPGLTNWSEYFPHIARHLLMTNADGVTVINPASVAEMLNLASEELAQRQDIINANGGTANGFHNNKMLWDNRLFVLDPPTESLGNVSQNSQQSLIAGNVNQPAIINAENNE